jgi:hypothetical protein
MNGSQEAMRGMVSVEKTDRPGWRMTPGCGAWLVAAVAVLLAGTCLLPYVFPRYTFVKGASFEAGFNNTLAYLWYVLALWWPARLLSRTVVLPQERGPQSLVARLPLAPGPVALAVLVVHLLLFAAMYAYKGGFVFAEALYFQAILLRMLAGEVPYVDFSFYYGPGMLYPAFWLAKLVGPDRGYALCAVATYFGGLALLFTAIRLALPNPGSADRWFALMALGFFNPWMGLNVTFLRYLLPVAVLISAAWYLRKGGAPAFLAALGFLTLAMLYTFDAAGVAVASVLLLIAAGMARDRLSALLSGTRDAGQGSESRAPFAPGSGRTPPLLRAGLLLASATLLCMGAFVWLDPTTVALRLYPAIALSYAAGAHNVPIYPNLPFVTLVGLTLVCIATLLGLLRQGRFRGREDLVLAATGFLLLMERGAFGVAEPLHFAYYGLPLFLLALFLVAWRQTLAAVLLVGIMLPMQYYNGTLFEPFVSRVLAEAPRETTAGGGPRSSAGVQATLVDLVHAVGEDRPYLMFQLDYYSYPVYRMLGLRYPTYFTFLSNARTEEDLCLVFRQIEATKPVVLVRRGDLIPETVPAAGHRGLRGLWDFLSGAHPAGSSLALLMQRSEERINGPLRQYLVSFYEIRAQRNDILALVPKSGPGTVPAEPGRPCPARL